MHDMVNQLDQAFNSDTYWTDLKRRTWRFMNDYTHSGIRQIGRRFNDNQVLQNYETGEILEVLNGINVALLLIAHSFFNIFNKVEASKEVETLLINYMEQ